MLEFKTFDLKIDLPKDKEVNVLGNNIKVRQYISSSEARDLLLITLQESVADHIINPYFLDINFHINLVKMFSDIQFDAEDDENVFELYDKLELTGILDEVVAAIPANIYTELEDYLDELVKKYEKYNHSITSIVNSFVEQMPENVNSAQEAIKQFDPETLKQIIELAKSTGYQN